MLQTPFKTILIGIAFSPSLRANVAEGLRLSRFFKAQLILVHVGDKTAQKEQQIDQLIQEFSEANQPIEIIWKKGKPVDVILQAASDTSADLLILGALQRERFLKYYVGSIARALTRKSTCSVLLMINPSEERLPCNHIVVNGLEDPKTKETITASFKVASALETGKLTVVEEISQNEIHIKVNDDRTLRKATIAQERIALREKTRVNDIIDAIDDDCKQNISVSTQSIFGKRGYSIGHYARVVRADLLIMNAPLKTGFFDRLFPHDIEYILSELPTDVLIVR